MDYNNLKRFLDIIMSICLTIVLSPLLITISIIVKCDSKGPIIFKQKRLGKDGKEFYIYKFRTMIKDNDLYDYSKENNITNFGKIIKKLELDELPQLINILKGDMSFVGPRPWIPEYYECMNDNQRKRYSIKPGLTGLAQINGRNNISILDKINYDLKYIDTYSLKQDISILFKTFSTIKKKENSSIEKKDIKKELDILKESNSKKEEVKSNLINKNIIIKNNYDNKEYEKKLILSLKK